MSKIKRYAETVSVEMGYAGELTPEVLEEASRRLNRSHSTNRSEHNNITVDYDTKVKTSNQLE